MGVPAHKLPEEFVTCLEYRGKGKAHKTLLKNSKAGVQQFFVWVYHGQRNFTRLNSTTWENPKDVLMFIREFKKLQCSEGGICAVSGGRKAKALTQTTMLQQNRIPEGEATLDGSDKVQRLQLSTQK